MTLGTPQVYCYNVLEVIKCLFGNPMFAGEMHFCAERVFDENGKCLFNEIWTSDWWWDVQSKLLIGSTVIPILLNSDATHLDTLGHQKVHPMYIMIGNIPKGVRQKSSRHAIVLLGYLLILKPTLQEKNIKKTFKRIKHQVFQYALKAILEQLIPIMKTGMMIPGPDGKICRYFPILASYSVDYPEACMICMIKQGFCIHCNVPKDCLHDISRNWSQRCSNDIMMHFQHSLFILKESSSNNDEVNSNMEEEEDILDHAENDGQSIEENSDVNYYESNEDDNNNIRTIPVNDYDGYHRFQDIPNIFWDWNLINIHQCMTPDKLHEVDKGVFHHLLNWFMMMVKSYYSIPGLEEMDWQFQITPRFTALQYFPQGISSLLGLSAKDYR